MQRKASWIKHYLICKPHINNSDLRFSHNNNHAGSYTLTNIQGHSPQSLHWSMLKLLKVEDHRSKCNKKKRDRIQNGGKHILIVLGKKIIKQYKTTINFKSLLNYFSNLTAFNSLWLQLPTMLPGYHHQEQDYDNGVQKNLDSKYKLERYETKIKSFQTMYPDCKCIFGELSINSMLSKVLLNGPPCINFLPYVHSKKEP